MRMQASQCTLFQQEGRMRSVRNLACLAVLAFSSFSAAVSQQPAQAAAAPQPAAPAAEPANAAVSPDTPKPLPPQTPQQKQLAEDTAKLLILANELKAEMDKSSKDTLSLKVIKKAEQVEKLAHKVREEMTASLTN
jgi:hypothetical protein